MTDESNEFGVGEFGTQFSSGAATDVKTILDDILTQSGTNPLNVTARTKALSFVNTTYATALKGRHWRFTNRELFTEMFAPYELGMVTVEDGSHEVVEYAADGDPTVTRWNSTMEGRMFCAKEPAVAGNYRINDIKSLSKMEILPGFSTATTPTNTSYRILHDRFLLDQKVQDVKSLVPLGFREMKPMGLQEFRARKSKDPGLTGLPSWYTTFSSEPQAGQLTIEVYPSPDKHYSFQVEYNERITRLEDSETCFVLIPPEHIDVLVLATRAAMYQDQNNIALAAEISKEARRAWIKMAGDQTMTDSKARLQHDRRYFTRNRNRARGYYGLANFGKFD